MPKPISLSKILQESKKISKDLAAIKLFSKANTGEVKKDGIIRLAKQIKADELRYMGFPEFVLKSWIEPTRLPIIPLKDNRWFDTQSIVTAETELDVDNIVYGGWVVDALRNQEFGAKTLSLNTTKDLDYKKYSQLLIFKKAAIQAMKIIDSVDDMGNDSSGINQEGIDNTNNNTPINNSPTSGGSDIPDMGTSTDNDFVDLS